MTAATLGGLALLERVGEEHAAVRGVLRKKKSERAAATAWMEAHLDLDRNHYGPRAWTTEWTYVYLWALERWAGFAGLEEIGGRDWYFEGANILVETQHTKAGGRGTMSSAGGFQGAGLPQACMAILFLKQAAPPLPVITGKR